MINTSNTTSTIATAKDKVLFLPGPLLNYQQQSEALASMNGIDPVRLNEVLQQIARTQRQRTSSSESEEAVNDRGVDTKSSVDRDQKSPFPGIFVFLCGGFFPPKTFHYIHIRYTLEYRLITCNLLQIPGILFNLLFIFGWG